MFYKIDWTIKTARIFLCISSFCYSNYSIANTCVSIQAKPLEIKVVIVAMFYPPPGSTMPGEITYWAKQEKLDQNYQLIATCKNVIANEKMGVIAIATGVGKVNASTSIMALGTDPQFNLTKAYWLIAGVSGINPHEGSVGSAVWTDWVVDGDLAYHIDAREIPSNWSTGYTPLLSGAIEPYPSNGPPKLFSCRISYQLNQSLTNWAFQLTRNTPLFDDEAMQKNRSRYKNMPQAEKPPFVLRGDNLTSDNFWHGGLLGKRAEEWVRYMTLGKGKYVTTGMEDSAILHSLLNLSKAGKIDWNRIMILRTASNYDREPPHWSAVNSLQVELSSNNSFSGYLPALDNSYRVGSQVVHELTKNWNIYRNELPKK